jgi:hypothetical protein
VELPSGEPQDGVLVVPVSNSSGRLCSQYRLEYAIYRGSGKYDKSYATMDLQQNGSLIIVIEGQRLKFVKHLVDGKPVLFDYIGQLLHADFSHPLCQIEPEDLRTVDDLYDRKQIIVAGCDPESEYGGISTFLKSSVGQKQFR